MTMLVQYVKNRDNLVGTVVALGKDQIGWSQCNKLDRSNGKRFDKERGLMIAKGRAEIGSQVKLGHKVAPIVEKMKIRAAKYFKDSVE